MARLSSIFGITLTAALTISASLDAAAKPRSKTPPTPAKNHAEIYRKACYAEIMVHVKSGEEVGTPKNPDAAILPNSNVKVLPLLALAHAGLDLNTPLTWTRHSKGKMGCGTIPDHQQAQMIGNLETGAKSLAIHSDNDAARRLTEVVRQSLGLSSTHDVMSALLRDLGMTRTVITDPSGCNNAYERNGINEKNPHATAKALNETPALQARAGNISTVRDMLKPIIAALRTPLVSTWLRLQSYQLPNGQQEFKKPVQAPVDLFKSGYTTPGGTSGIGTVTFRWEDDRVVVNPTVLRENDATYAFSVAHCMNSQNVQTPIPARNGRIRQLIEQARQDFMTRFSPSTN